VALATQFATAGLTEWLGDIRLAITVLAAAIVPGVLVFRFALPETKNQRLEDLDRDETG
jgi:hypothetical protein